MNAVNASVPCSPEKITPSVLERLLPRPEDSHKGTFGMLTMLCGSPMMPGAAALAAYGALRSGVGLVRIACPAEVRTVLQARLAEPVWIQPESCADGKSTAFLAGCGLGRSSDGLLRSLLPRITCPSVFDADAIRFFASDLPFLRSLGAPFILTPHPGEFSALTGLSAEEIRSSRERLASEFASSFRCTLVLKGHRTVVALPDGRTFVNETGSSALAKGGSGDVLAGLIASLLAQGQACADAAMIGVYVHGLAGDLLEKKYGPRGVLPSDLPAVFGRILNNPKTTESEAECL